MLSKRQLTSQLLVRSGFARLLRRGRRGGGVLALNYHRIGDPSACPLDRGVFSATAEEFDWQMGFLKRECDVIVPEDLASDAALTGGHCVMVTFDDGYRDNHDVALPILTRHGLRATFFVATGYIDQPRVPWWDEIAWMIRSSSRDSLEPSLSLPVSIVFDSPARQRAIDQVLGVYKALPGDATGPFLEDLAAACGTGRCPREAAEGLWMSWDMIRELRDAGMTIGGHTVHHPILSQLPRFQQEEEILGCAARLAEQLQQPTRFFAYPRGKLDAFNQDTRACLYEARIERAFSYYGGVNIPGHIDAYDVKRVAVEIDTRRTDFEALISMPAVFAGL